MTTRNFMNSRPIGTIPTLRRGNAIPVVAESARGNRHIFSSITNFVSDVEGLTLSDRRTATRRVASGGGYVGNWYVTDLRGYNG